MREILYRPFFPYYNASNKRFINDVMLGIGGNVGNCLKRFELLFKKIASHIHFAIISTSPIYKNPAFGFENQADFYNATIHLSTRFGIVELFSIIFYWERCFGRERKRAFKNAPRTLDIDLLWFNQIKLKRPYLQVPHLHWEERESVLIPLELQFLFKERRI